MSFINLISLLLKLLIYFVVLGMEPHRVLGKHSATDLYPSPSDFEIVLLNGPGWPPPVNPPASASQVLGLQMSHHPWPSKVPYIRGKVKTLVSISNYNFPRNVAFTIFSQ
jgi:hypothetical protein